MATCKTCSFWNEVDSGSWLNGCDRQPATLNATNRSIVSLARCAEMQENAMNQGAEVTMNR
jgi:hypothetical protein